MGHKYGLQEINYDLLGQVLNEVNIKKEYPFVMMPPPHSLVKIGGGKDNGWKIYRIDLFFCDTTYYNTADNKANVTAINTRTRTSTEPVIDIWSRMDNCGMDFIQVLSNYQSNVPSSTIRLLSTQNNFVVPFSEVSIDRVSGIRLSFDLQLFIGCELTDYDEINYETLIL